MNLHRPTQSVYANGLRLSGLLGVVAGVSLEAANAAATDPVLGSLVSIPPGADQAGLLVTLSLLALVYASAFDRYFDGWLDVALGAGVIAQWGLPLGLALDAVVGPLSGFRFLAVIAATVHAGFALAVTVQFLRTSLAPGSG